jgi:hypothetical protein
VFDEFSKPALAAVLAAQQEARQRGRAELGPPDLLRAAVRWGTVRNALRELGADPDATAMDDEGATGRVEVRGPIPYTAPARAVLHRATDLRVRFDLPQVTLGVLLAALLDDEGNTGIALRAGVADIDRARSLLARLPDPPDESLKVAGHRVGGRDSGADTGA